MNNLNELKSKITDANSVLILLPPQPDLDSCVAALALNQALEESDKNSMVGCSDLVSEKYPDLQDAKKIRRNIGNQTLVVSFDYQEEAVENVSYDIDDATKKFNLRIQPRSGQQPLDAQNITYSYTGATADLVITLGINSLEELGALYSDEKLFLDQATIANLNSGAKPSTFAAVNVSLNSNYSEAIATLIKSLELTLTPATATQIFQQLTKSTNGFSTPTVTADTFELAAYLLRQGAQAATTQPRLPFMPPAAPIVPPQVQATQDPTSPVPPDWQGPKIYRGGSPLR